MVLRIRGYSGPSSQAQMAARTLDGQNHFWRNLRGRTKPGDKPAPDSRVIKIILKFLGSSIFAGISSCSLSSSCHPRESRKSRISKTTSYHFAVSVARSRARRRERKTIDTHQSERNRDEKRRKSPSTQEESQCQSTTDQPHSPSENKNKHVISVYCQPYQPKPLQQQQRRLREIKWVIVRKWV